MSFNAAVSITTSSDVSAIILTDTSTGSDSNLIDRKISLFKTDGSLLTGVITWPLAQSSITIQVLPQDYALNVSVLFNTSVVLPSPSVYTASQIYAFNGYGQAFMYYLTQLLTAKPIIMQDSDYWSNKALLQLEMDCSQNCITIGKDLAGAQGCIDRYNFLIKNNKYKF